MKEALQSSGSALHHWTTFTCHFLGSGTLYTLDPEHVQQVKVNSTVHHSLRFMQYLFISKNKLVILELPAGFLNKRASFRP